MLDGAGRWLLAELLSDALVGGDDEAELVRGVGGNNDVVVVRG